MQSFTGKILHIDLTHRKSWVQTVDDAYLKRWIGGVGLAARLAYENTAKGADPLGPDNALCFAASSFAGTLVPVGSKHGVAAKSPLTNRLGDCLASSYFSQSFRRAGYDGIVITGAADKWIYVFVDDDTVTFRDASHLLGKHTFETEEAIREELGDEAVRVSTIGLAGEKLVRFANITNDRGRQAGRTGLGAVMGAKKLKALAVRGSKPIDVADPQGLLEKAKALTKLSVGPKTEKYRVMGTPSNVLNMNRLGVLPTRNYQSGTFEHADKVSGEVMLEQYVEKAVSCAGCSIACEHITRVREGDYAGARTSVDYESLFALGPNCGVDNLAAIIKAIETCDNYGMDTMSSGVTISWAMECYQRGILTKEDFGGLEPDWGNHAVVIKLAEMIAKREGIGDLLAEGTKRAAEKIGQGSAHFAMNVKGLEAAGYDARGFQTFALGCAVGTRGPCHNRSLAYEPDAKGEVDRLKTEPARGQIAKDCEELAALFDCAMLCKFIRGCLKDAWSEVSELFTMTTGIPITAAEMRQAMERVWNMKKAFNIREGWTRAEDWLPDRWTQDPMPEGGSKGAVVSPEGLKEMIDAYYLARGWTPEGLIPKDKLAALDMADVAEDIGV